MRQHLCHLWPGIAAILTLAPIAQVHAAGPEKAKVVAQMQLQVDENNVQATVEARIAADGPEALDLDKAPLQLPMPAPVVGDAVLDRGTLPATARTVEFTADPPLKVEHRAGGLVVRGQLATGQQATVRARMVLGFKAPQLRVGVRGVGAKTWTSLVVMSAAPARIGLQVSKPARISTFEQGNERLVGASLGQPLARDEVAVFQLDDLPATAEAPRKALVSLGVAVTLVACWLIARRRAIGLTRTREAYA